MKEDWIELNDFPQYAVSNHGYVVNLKTGVIRKATSNYQGIAKVTISNEGRLYTKAIGVLVATAFLKPARDIFNTVISLDGNRMNCHVENLMWRPRWFAIRYHRQFFEATFCLSTMATELMDTGEIFNNLKEPAMKYGLLARDIAHSSVNEGRVFPTGQQFRRLV